MEPHTRVPPFFWVRLVSDTMVATSGSFEMSSNTLSVTFLARWEICDGSIDGSVEYDGSDVGTAVVVGTWERDGTKDGFCDTEGIWDGKVVIVGSILGGMDGLLLPVGMAEGC